ncbi:metal ABC transporter solute-binding protein, Zn/Mn family [Cytobacillus sp. Hz8]|uniref:metal ABC transporter solute-binding protein, Zn/Mn family n=1 Tax=Cytobacillus sp. Hz8 TaxID=3347168 RepID=UPI0035E08310
MNKRISAFFLLFFSFSLILAGCSSSNETKKNKDKLSIYTTVYPLQYFTERIGGKYVQIDTIYPPGADEHTFEPTQKDMMKLADSDLFIYIGLGLEGFVNSAKDTLKNENVRLVAAGDQLPIDKATAPKDEEEGDHDHGDINPHVWLDPVYSKDMVAIIEKELIKAMPEHKKEFTANSQKLTAELDQLNTKFEKVISHSAHKEIIVSHAAFGYWEQRYHIKQISISGLSTSNEPTQKELKSIIVTAKKEKLKYIFFEQNVSSKLTKIVEKEIGAKPLTLHNLAVRTDKDIKQNRDYMSIMEDNLAALKIALNE